MSSFLVNLQAEHLFIQLYLPLNDNTKLKILILAINTVEPPPGGNLRFLKKVSAIIRCPLYSDSDVFNKKIIIHKNLTIFYNAMFT